MVQTDFASFNVTVKGETAKLGRDSVKFNGQFNVGNLKNLEVNGYLFAFRIGGATYEGRFDKTGKVVSADCASVRSPVTRDSTSAPRSPE